PSRSGPTTSTRRAWYPTGWPSGWRRRRTSRDATRARARQRRKPQAIEPTRRRRQARPAWSEEQMSKELLLVVDAVANEKGVPESVILEAIEAALATAAKKRYLEEDVLTRVQIDPKDGSYQTFRRWEVVADDVVMESPDRQIRMMDVVDDSPEAEVGDFIEEQIDNVDFGR